MSHRYNALVRNATCSLNSALTVLKRREEGGEMLDWHTVRVAANQASQAANELYNLLGWLEREEDERRKAGRK